MEQIFINNKQLDKVVLIADSDPNEVCGVMLGNDSIVKEIVMVKNEKPSPYYFEFSSAELGKAYMYAMENNLKILGIYHSHPQNRPNPSSTDFDWMEEHRGIWLIYSPKFGYYKSWRRENTEIIPVNTILQNKMSSTEQIQKKIWDNKEDEFWDTYIEPEPMTGRQWWSWIMFNYIYPDGNAECVDEQFKKEIDLMTDDLSNQGLRYCNSCDNWLKKGSGCYNCEY